jgi:hypothetical protein
LAKQEAFMDTPRNEFTLAQLIDEPAVGLAMEDAGLDRRSLELLLGNVSRPAEQVESLPHAPFVS